MRSLGFLLTLLATLTLALPASALQWAPAEGAWGKVEATDLRVMTWNVEDALCRTNPKVEGGNNWNACARIVASLRPDVLLLQECGDNEGNGTGSGVDTVAQLTTVMQLFVNGGTDPFLGGAVTSYVRKYAPDLSLPHIFVSQSSDGFNRNVILSRYPFADLNGDGVATLSNIPNVTPHLYAPGGTGGIRGFQFAEIDLPDGVYLGDIVVANAHLKAGGTGSDQQERNTAARNVAYYIDHLLNGAGTGQPDPFGRIADNPAALTILAQNTPLILGGDWNEDELTNGQKGPARWLTEASLTGCCDGTDRDRTDMMFDSALHFFTGNRGTRGAAKLDYLAWQDSIAQLRLAAIFDTVGTPSGALPAELSGFPGPGNASSIASDHRAVLIDVVLPRVFVCSDPISYCAVAPNSTGSMARMRWVGAPSIAGNAFHLLVEDAVPGQFGLFFYGANATQQAFGNGWRCVGGQGIYRLLPPQLADSFGDVLRQLDFTQGPASGGAGRIQPGSTWRFQFWYRDPAAGGAHFNLSDGLAVQFCP
jgi:endonuclease/exonuclease/phosphatase family metal-dependent hydrolase